MSEVLLKIHNERERELTLFFTGGRLDTETEKMKKFTLYIGILAKRRREINAYMLSIYENN